MKVSKEIKAGVIAILAIVGFVLLFQFMKGKSLFTTDNVFYAKYDNVEGLTASSPVSINGLKVGKVDQIIPISKSNGDIHFVVKLLVHDDFQFSTQSTVEIFEPGIMSAKEMKINLASGGTMAKDGDTLKGAFKMSMLNNISSQVGPVKDQVQEVLRRVDSLTSNANKIFDDQNRAEIRALLINLNRAVSALEGTSGSVNSLIANNDPRVQRVLDNANETMISANVAVDKYGNLAESIDTRKLNSTINNLDRTVSKLNDVIVGIENGQGSLGKLAKDEQLYDNLQETSKNLNELVMDLKANPKRYLNFSVFGKSSKD